MVRAQNEVFVPVKISRFRFLIFPIDARVSVELRVHRKPHFSVTVVSGP